MKLLIASDIHGDLDSAQLLIDIYKKEECDKILLLGDILYHGPRNDLPPSYNPKAVISLLNEHSPDILSVRGNCDTEVDQMVLDFPVLADYGYVYVDGVTIYATHGHIYNMDTPPKLKQGDVLMHGHTHLLGITRFGDENMCVNPGSIALPKGNNPRSYAILEDGIITIYDIDKNQIKSEKIK